MLEQESALLFPFIDQSEIFVLGFEAGQFYEALKAGNPIKQKTIHTQNVQQVRVMAEAMGYAGLFEDTGIEGWSYATFKPKKARNK
jgi:hypothetical protein